MKSIQTCPANTKKRLNKQKYKLRKRGPSYILCLVIVLIVYILSYYHYQKHIIELAKVKKEKTQEYLTLKQNEKNLRTEIRNLNNPQYVEQLARRDYYLAKEDEILFVFK